MQVGRLATRAVIGGLFVGHGTQKLFGWFGGPGPEGTRQMMRSLDMQPEHHHAMAAGLSEAAGGALLALGLATPLAASSLIGTMVTAIRKVHLANGPWVTNGGYEYNLVLIAVCAALAEAGPGPMSLDHALGIERQGPKWALGALALGTAASFAAVEYGRRNAAGARGGAAYPGSDSTGTADVTEQHPAGDPVTSQDISQP